MGRRLRRVMLLAGAAICIATWAWGPLLLRRVDWFEIRRVEISGAHLLRPAEVLEASGVVEGQNLWDDRGAWISALLAHDAIEGAAVSRRVPGTLRIHVSEKQPVAYVEAGALRLATAGGELLPVDPSRAAVDLPILRARWADSASVAGARRLLAEVGRIAALDPGLLAAVSEIGPAGSDPDALVLSHRVAEVVLPGGVDAIRLAELRAVLAHVGDRPGSAAPGARAPRPLVDLRFRDQIVVRYPKSV